MFNKFKKLSNNYCFFCYPLSSFSIMRPSAVTSKLVNELLFPTSMHFLIIKAYFKFFFSLLVSQAKEDDFLIFTLQIIYSAFCDDLLYLNSFQFHPACLEEQGPELRQCSSSPTGLFKVRTMFSLLSSWWQPAVCWLFDSEKHKRLLSPENRTQWLYILTVKLENHHLNGIKWIYLFLSPDLTCDYVKNHFLH